jgi:hypothetical protein
MEDDIKRWTAKRKTTLILDIIQGKTTVGEVSLTSYSCRSGLRWWPNRTSA